MKMEAVTKPFSSLKNLDEPMDVAIIDEILFIGESLPEFKGGQDAKRGISTNLIPSSSCLAKYKIPWVSSL